MLANQRKLYPLLFDCAALASISSTESSSASAVAQKESALAYKITRISLVPSLPQLAIGRTFKTSSKRPKSAEETYAKTFVGI